jgi:hypothetical protein
MYFLRKLYSVDADGVVKQQNHSGGEGGGEFESF